MTHPTDLAWLTVDATVAYVANRRLQSSRVFPAHVDKIGKRDVNVTVNGRTEKFNINHVNEDGWLYRRADWEPSTYLAPLNDPAVAAIGAQQVVERAAERVVKAAAAFSETRDAATAHQLRDTIDEFLTRTDTKD